MDHRELNLIKMIKKYLFSLSCKILKLLERNQNNLLRHRKNRNKT